MCGDGCDDGVSRSCFVLRVAQLAVETVAEEFSNARIGTDHERALHAVRAQDPPESYVVVAPGCRLGGCGRTVALPGYGAITTQRSSSWLGGITGSLLLDDFEDDLAIRASGSGVQQGPERLCRSPLLADHTAEVFLVDPELEHRRVVGLALRHLDSVRFRHKALGYELEKSPELGRLGLQCFEIGGSALFRRLATVGVGFAPFFNHELTFSASSLTSAGSVDGL